MRLNYLGHRQDVFESGDDSIFATCRRVLASSSPRLGHGWGSWLGAGWGALPMTVVSQHRITVKRSIRSDCGRREALVGWFVISVFAKCLY